MNPLDDYFYLGKIINPNGYKGKLNAYLDTDDPDFYADLKIIFLLINGLPVPHFVESIRITNNKAVLELKNVDTLEKAQALSQTDLYLPISELPPLSGNQFYYHEVIGFVILDKKYGKLGEIEQVLEYPNQAVFQLTYNGSEVLIPINNEIIRTVNRENKEIHVVTPDGLIDIYTSEK
jgi:16S rRNA processing protein RimM